MKQYRAAVRCLALCLSLVLLLAGCGQSADSGSASPTVPLEGAGTRSAVGNGAVGAPAGGNDDFTVGSTEPPEDAVTVGNAEPPEDAITIGQPESSEELEPEPDAGPYAVPPLEYTIDAVTYNTDEPGTGLSISIDQIVGNCIILKVVNDSDVCYEMVGYHIYQNARPDLGMFTFVDYVPCHSTVYDVKGMPESRKYTSKSEDLPSDIMGYEDWSTDISVELTDWRVSDTLLLDASQYLNVELLDENTTEDGSLALLRNPTDKILHVVAYTILDEKEVSPVGYQAYFAGMTYAPPSTSFPLAYGIKLSEAGEDYETYGEGNPIALFCGTYLIAPEAIRGLTAGEVESGDFHTADPSQYSTKRLLIAKAYFTWDDYE